MVAIGVILGLASGLAHSLGFIFSRRFVTQTHHGMWRLLVLGQIMMGTICAMALPLIWSRQIPPIGTYIMPLMGWVICYLLGQILVFAALRRADASRISPLLALKIVVLAMFTVLILGDRLSPLQWSAVLVAVSAAFVLNYSGVQIAGRSILAAMLACVAFALSDLNIVELVGRLGVLGKARAAMWGVSLGTVICGLVGLAAAPLLGKGAWRDAGKAMPYAICWLAGVALIFACFAYVGALFGNILQSTRGLFSIVIGAQLARLGLVHLEGRTSRSVFVRRLAAATMMVLAIAMYLLG